MISNNISQWITFNPLQNKYIYNNAKSAQEEPPNMETSTPEESTTFVDGQFQCHLCRKTFYNLNALNNHKKLQHDMDSDSDIYFPKYTKLTDHSINGLCGFKFVPLDRNSHGNLLTDKDDDGLVVRVFEQDTSYIIIKIEHYAGELEAAKRRRLEGVVKKAQMKPGKPSVDLSRGPFTCTFPLTHRPEQLCRQIFFNCCAYSLHYRELHTKRRKAALRCQVCEKRLDRDIYAEDVIEPAAPEVERPKYTCGICVKTFMERHLYDQHNRLVHAKLKPHQCGICLKRFTQQGGLQQHMRMHSGIRPFVCSYCSKTFTQKAGLDQHIRTHTKVKPFICIICCKSFSQSVHLRQHMRTHTNIQPFKCVVCDRRFKQSSHLKFHMKSHREIGNGDEHNITSPQPEKPDDSIINFLNWSDIQPIGDCSNMYYNSNLTSTQEQSPQEYYTFEDTRTIEKSMMII